MIARMPRTASFALAAAVTRTLLVALRAKGLGDGWERKNHAGRTVDLYAAPATVAGTALAAARVRPAAGFAALGAAVVAGNGRAGSERTPGPHKRPQPQPDLSQPRLTLSRPPTTGPRTGATPTRPSPSSSPDLTNPAPPHAPHNPPPLTRTSDPRAPVALPHSPHTSRRCRNTRTCWHP